MKEAIVLMEKQGFNKDMELRNLIQIGLGQMRNQSTFSYSLPKKSTIFDHYA